MPENEEALELWLEVNTQWRAGGMGVIGLDYPAVYAEAARVGLEVSNCVMRKIKALERWTLKELAADVDRSRTGAKKAGPGSQGGKPPAEKGVKHRRAG